MISKTALLLTLFFTACGAPEDDTPPVPKTRGELCDMLAERTCYAYINIGCTDVIDPADAPLACVKQSNDEYLAGVLRLACCVYGDCESPDAINEDRAIACREQIDTLYTCESLDDNWIPPACR